MKCIVAGAIFKSLLLALILVLMSGSAKAQSLSNFTLLTPTAITATSYTDSTCNVPGLVCTYVVTATNSFGTSGPSNQAVATVPAAGTPPQIGWTASSGATGYFVYVGKAPAPPVVSVTVQ